MSWSDLMDFPPPLKEHNDFNSANFEIVPTNCITSVESKMEIGDGSMRSIRQRQHCEGCCQFSGRSDVVA